MNMHVPTQRLRRLAKAVPLEQLFASYDRVALVFQGGGALGAYQAGVYEALCGAGIEPDWVIGTSIGAICLLYTSPSPRDKRQSRMPSSA